jgi:diaminohydroxyphosphoribosylaminopyrimidine deaminase/5-amino-6-(5-phosphoribosylamino)uracil reductase
MNRILPEGLGPLTSSVSPTADDFYLDRAIDLAWLGSGKTLENPMVGAVVTRDGRIVGEGYHEAFGLAHAESVALDQAGQRARGATLYVTLEPCTHQGKTPPCVGRIIGSGVERVVVCTADPDPRMDGLGIEALRSRGIQVDVGPRAERAILLNLPYFKRMMKLGCAVTIKAASTWDGRIASRPGARDSITGTESQVFVHRLRATHEGVLIGINTLLVDRPRLDCRWLEGVRDPAPVVLDTRFRFPVDYRWLKEGRRFLVITGDEPANDKLRQIEAGGGAVLRCDKRGDHVDETLAMRTMMGWGVSSVLVEGGADVLTSFLGSETWDALRLFVSPGVYGPEGVTLVSSLIDAGDAVLAGAERFGQDVLISYLKKETYTAITDCLVEGR